MKINRAVSRREETFSATELVDNKPATHQNLWTESKGKERIGKNTKKHHVASLTTSLIICSSGWEAVFLHVCKKHLPVAQTSTLWFSQS